MKETAANEFKNIVKRIKQSGKSKIDEVSEGQKEVQTLQQEKKGLLEANRKMAVETAANVARIGEIDIRVDELLEEIRKDDLELREILQELIDLSDGIEK